MQDKLKNGELVTIRPPRLEDAEGLIELMQRVNAETRFLARGPGEFNVTVEKERAFIEGVLADEDGAWFTAEVGGRIVGNCSVGRVGRQKRFRHRATIALSVEQAHCSLGIGSRFMQAVIDWCRSKGIEQLELEVAAKNEPGLRLYTKFGFEVTGRMPRALKYADGDYDDLVAMVKPLGGTAAQA